MQCFCDGKIIYVHNNRIAIYGAVSDYRIRVTEAEWTEKMQKSIGVDGRFGGYEGLRGTCKERIKCMSRAYVTDKERSTNGLCRMSNGCITDKTNMFRICNGQNVR